MQKADITAALVGRLIAEQFPHWANLPVRPVPLDGWDNTSFRLGDDLLVRLPSAAGYAAQVEKEQRWLPVLAPQLPLPIPKPVARGEPGAGYPFAWSIHGWLPGKPAAIFAPADLTRFALDLAGFLSALYRIDASDGPPPGAHSFLRGASPAVYDAQTRDAISALADVIDAGAATELWDAAIATTWTRSPVWVHGDVVSSNLLVVDGRLSAVIDFGCSAVGDPSCDLTIAWTFFEGESREAFRSALPLDDATWARARGWALWKALITLADEGLTGADAEAAVTRWGWRVGPAELVNDLLRGRDATRVTRGPAWGAEPSSAGVRRRPRRRRGGGR